MVPYITNTSKNAMGNSKEYTSCFLGIPLPTRFQAEFETLLREVNQICPSLETVRPQTPHITVYYFGKVAKASINDIYERMLKYIQPMRNAKLKVHGLDTFTRDRPKVIFLSVKYPIELVRLRKSLQDEFNYQSDTDNEYSFHPHVTVARARDILAEQCFTQNRAQIESLAVEASWSFTANELSVYGVDSTQHPEFQEKIKTVNV